MEGRLFDVFEHSDVMQMYIHSELSRPLPTIAAAVPCIVGQFLSAIIKALNSCL